MLLQCATVIGLPAGDGSANLPNVLPDSLVTNCRLCRKAVWLSATAVRALGRRADVTPVCEECHPANPVTITPDKPANF